MAFDIKDFYMHYHKKGDPTSHFNVVREDTTSAVVQYFAYQNDEGSFIIQRSTTSGSLTVLVYNYYSNKIGTNLSTDWSNRASLSYVEYYQLFQQGS